MPVCRRLTLAILGPLAWLSGCAQFSAATDRGHQIEATEQVSRVDQHSSFPAMRRANFEEVNLLELIDPKAESLGSHIKKWPTRSDGSADHASFDFGKAYDGVLAWFRESINQENKELKRMHRNGVQDKILAVSTSRCNVFKTYLRRQQTETNFLLGSATTVAGVLGAVLQGANASRNLAGAAGLFSGLRAEYNQTYYSNLAAHIIAQGIDLQQAKLKQELVVERQKRDIYEYSMEAAINDAIYIDGTCSTVTGLLQAQDAIKEIQNPGLVSAMNGILFARALDEANTADLKTLASSGRLEELRKLTTPTPSPLVVSMSKPSPLSGIVSAQERANDASGRLSTRIDQQAQRLATAYEDKLKILASGSDQTPTRAEVRNAFASHMRTLVPGTSTAALTLRNCTVAIGTPTLAVSKATTELALTPVGTAQQVDKQAEVETETAKLRAAIAKVELVIAAMSTAIDDAASKLIADLPKKKEDLATFIDGKIRKAVYSPDAGTLSCS